MPVSHDINFYVCSPVFFVNIHLNMISFPFTMLISFYINVFISAQVCMLKKIIHIITMLDKVEINEKNKTHIIMKKEKSFKVK